MLIMSTSALIYARTSPDCPISAEDQIEGLKAVADQNGWTVIKIFSDRPMPMKKGKERRPGEDALLEMVKTGDVQKVLLWSIDRVGRSLVKLVGIIEMCRTGGIGLYIHDQKLDTSSSNGLGLFDLGEMLAFHLRQGRRDKILRGQAAAREAVWNAARYLDRHSIEETLADLRATERLMAAFKP